MRPRALLGPQLSFLEFTTYIHTVLYSLLKSFQLVLLFDPQRRVVGVRVCEETIQ